MPGAEERSAADYARGLATGLAIAITVLHVYLVLQLGTFETLYKEFSGASHLPAVTRVVLSPLWQWGSTLAAVVLLGILVIRRPVVLACGLAGAVIAVLAAVTWYGMRAPIHQIAGVIQGG